MAAVAVTDVFKCEERQLHNGLAMFAGEGHDGAASIQDEALPLRCYSPNKQICSSRARDKYGQYAIAK